ncbi:MAG: L,D-transpeptidase, partial [bacterium]
MLHVLLVSVLSANMLVATPTPALGAARASLLVPSPLGLVDSIVVEKKAHTLTLYRDGKPMRTYLVA